MMDTAVLRMEQLTTGAEERDPALRSETTMGGQRFMATHGSGTGGRSLEAELELQLTLASLALVDEPEAVVVGHDGRYAIRRLIGRGAMGAVYFADDVALRRPVAIKVVSKRVPDRSGFQDRLRREAWALALLDHPNVLQIHDVDLAPSGELFIVMQYVPGHNLRQWVEAVRPTRAQILDALIAAGRGLAAAHHKGLVHRDFKPDNVMVHEHEGVRRVLVADFGLAGGAPLRLGAASGPGSAAAKDIVTRAAFLGTPAYMAPEQRRGESADARSDQYAFCVSLWELLVGERPHPEHLHLRPPELPSWLYRLLRRGLAEQADERFPDMATLLDALEHTPARRRRYFSIGGALTLGALLAFVGSLLGSRPEPTPASTPAACLAVDAQLEQVWNAERRELLAGHLRALAVDDPERLAANVIANLDQAALRWEIARRGACERDDDELARCHARWLESFDRRVTLLSELDAAGVQRSSELLEPLRAGSLCDLSSAPLEHEVQQLLDRAEEAEDLANYDEALSLTEAAREAARGAPPCGSWGDYSHELAAVAFRVGHVHGERHDGVSALASLDEAAQHAAACGDDRLSITARLRAAKIAAIDLEDAERAERHWREARASIAHATPSRELPERLQWEYMLTAGVVEMSKGKARHDRAQDWFEVALDSFEDEQPLLRAEAHINLGVIAHARGDRPAATRAFERAREVVEAVYWASPPEVDIAVLNLAIVDGDLDGLRAAAASVHPSVRLRAQTALLEHHVNHGELDRARALAPELLALARAHLEQPPADRAVALSWAGQLLADAGDREGLAALGEALSLYESLDGEGESRNGCELSLAWNAMELGELALARAHHEAALARELSDEHRAYARELGRELEEKISDD